jgi:glutathione S-transferase
MTAPILYIGNKNYSSWSLRPWLALRWAGIAFDEQVLPLGGDGYGQGRAAHVLAVSPSGRVPALHLGGSVIHDSLAISEWAAEQPGARLFPADPLQRALVRAAVAEMHAGFGALRRDLSMNIRRRLDQAPPWPADTTADLDRLFSAWTGWRTAASASGLWLFGQRTLADAFYAPVVTRLRTYAVPVSPLIADYMTTVLADADFQDWEAAAIAEPMQIPQTDALYQKVS